MSFFSRKKNYSTLTNDEIELKINDHRQSIRNLTSERKSVDCILTSGGAAFATLPMASEIKKLTKDLRALEAELHKREIDTIPVVSKSV